MNFHFIEIDLPFVFGGLESYLIVELIQKYKYYEKENQLTIIDNKKCFFYTYESIQQRLPFSRCQLDTIIKNLKIKNVIEVYKKGLPARNYFYFNFNVFNSLRESYKLVCSNPTIYNVEILQTSNIDNNTEKTLNLDNSNSLRESNKVEMLQTSLLENNNVVNSQTTLKETDNDINNYLLITKDNNNIDIVDEKILFSQSIYFERFSLFESDMKKVFAKKNIDFSYYYKNICNGKKTQSEKYTNTEWKQFFINAIQFLIDKNGLVKIEKEKKQLHSFEKSIYYDNYELFKTEFEEKYPEIDAKYYYDEFSLSCKAKGYKNIDWKAVFQKWINKLQGDYKKVNHTSQSEQPKQETVSKLNPTGKKYYLTDLKKHQLEDLFSRKNARNILQELYFVTDEIDLWHKLNMIDTKNNYNIQQIWSQYEPTN